VAAAAAAQPVAAAAVQPVASAATVAQPAAAVAAAAAATTTTSPTSQAPVRVVLMNRFYYGDRYARSVPGCTWDGEPLPCEFTSDRSAAADADALA
jgi:hypothetical protein